MHKNETLQRSGAELAAGFEFGSVLRELCAHRRTGMHNRHAIFIPGSGVRTKVSAVSKDDCGCCELRVWPRLCTVRPFLKFG